MTMSLKNLMQIIICLSALLITATTFSAPVSARRVMAEPPPYQFMEEVIVMVNCSEATLTAVVSLITLNETLVRYPLGVNMMDLNFALCESVSVSVTPMGSTLVYIFDTTDTSAATTNANAITPSIGGAFGLSFSFLSAGLTEDSKANVTYTAPAITNVLSYYTATLNPSCLKSDLAGLSNAIPNILTMEPSKSYAGISANKESGGYEWWYMFFVGYYEAQIPTGAGYTIDVLNRIGATSLTPSSYAYTGAYYDSIVPVYITSHLSISFVSCNPTPPIMIPGAARGWFIFEPFPQTGTAMFYFGNDATPVTALTFTFSGIIVPEFSSLTVIIAMIVCALGVIAFKKRYPK